MRITLNLDDDLIAKAQKLTGITNKRALVHEGLRTLIQREQRESARKSALLGGTEPQLKPIPRRRSD